MKRRGPCPDPDRYIWVHDRKGGGHWRRKRGTVKPAVLNSSLAANAENSKLTIPAARRFLDKLNSYTKSFARDMRLQRVASLFNRDLKANGEMSYRYFERFEMQKDHPLNKIYIEDPKIMISKGVLEAIIPLKGNPVLKKGPWSTHYYLELIIITGDPAKEKALRVESDCSKLYEFENEYTDEIKLSLQLPAKKPWVAFLKCGSMQGKDDAPNKKNYGMKVVGWG